MGQGYVGGFVSGLRQIWSQIRIGDNPPEDDELGVDGSFHLTHTAESNDDHAIEVDCDAAGYGDVRAILLEYTTGAMATGKEEAVILINLDETSATGGDVAGLEMLATEGSADKVFCIFAGAQVDPIEHLSGSFADSTLVDVNGVEKTTELSDGGAGNEAVFTADNDYVIVGSTALFEEVEMLFGTFASANINATFEYSTGSGPTTWATFSPTDGTNGCQSNGIIVWRDADIPSWAIGNASSEYLIRITRTRNNLPTTPIADKVQVVAATEYGWDKNADLNVRNVTFKEMAAPGTPASNKAVMYLDAADNNLKVKWDSGNVSTIGTHS